MTARAYYNEIDPYAAQWLRNLISAGHIAPGDVDERSIVDVQPDDLKGYNQCHFFAGIGGWSVAARLAGWPDYRPLWTGSCPCQPFSAAGKGEGQADERHLWPVFFSLISAERPPVVMGEQVAAAVGKDWLDGVHSDLESIGYACGAAVVPACAIDAPHRRDRLWFVADASHQRLDGSRTTGASWRDEHSNRSGVDVADSNEPCEGQGREQRSRELGRSGGDPGCSSIAMAHSHSQPVEWRPKELFAAQGESARRSNHGPWGACEWLQGPDGKARRIEPSIRLLAHGVPARVGKLRAYGNAIVPQVAAEVIGAYMDATSTSGAPNGEQQHG